MKKRVVFLAILIAMSWTLVAQAADLSDNNVRELGQLGSTIIEHHFGTSWSDSRINEIGQRINRLTGQNYEFRVLNTRELIAIGFPNGKVYVSKGLLSRVGNDPHQLAFVVSREVAHLECGHMDKAFRIGKGADYELAKQIVSSIWSRGYPQLLEKEADLRGLEWAVKAGYHPYGGVFLLRGLKDIDREDFKALGSYRSSSRLLERLALIELEAERIRLDSFKPAETQKRLSGNTGLDARPEYPNVDDPKEKIPSDSPAPVSLSSTFTLPVEQPVEQPTEQPDDQIRVAIMIEDATRGSSGSNRFWMNRERPQETISSSLATAISQSGKAVVVERAQLQETWKEQDLLKTGRMEPGTVAEIGHTWGASHILVVTLTNYGITSGGRVRIGRWGKNIELEPWTAEICANARLIEVQRGTIVWTGKFSGKETSMAARADISKWWFVRDRLEWYHTPAGQATQNLCSSIARSLAREL